MPPLNSYSDYAVGLAKDLLTKHEATATGLCEWHLLVHNVSVELNKCGARRWAQTILRKSKGEEE